MCHKSLSINNSKYLFSKEITMELIPFLCFNLESGVVEGEGLWLPQSLLPWSVRADFILRSITPFSSYNKIYRCISLQPHYTAHGPSSLQFSVRVTWYDFDNYYNIVIQVRYFVTLPAWSLLRHICTLL